MKEMLYKGVGLYGGEGIFSETPYKSIFAENFSRGLSALWYYPTQPMSGGR
jgi:hypothetical protein